jgi:uncharacterized protein (DUF2062 family)
MFFCSQGTCWSLQILLQQLQQPSLLLQLAPTAAAAALRTAVAPGFHPFTEARGAVATLLVLQQETEASAKSRVPS